MVYDESNGHVTNDITWLYIIFLCLVLFFAFSEPWVRFL